MSERYKMDARQLKHVYLGRIARPLAVIWLCGLPAMQAAAVEESFDYTDGLLDGKGVVSEWTGAWQPGPASLTGTPPTNLPFQVESNQLKIDFSDQGAYGYEDWDVERTLASPIGTPSVYVSFEVTPADMGSVVGANDDGYGWLNIGFSDSTANISNGPMFSIYEYFVDFDSTTYMRIGSSLDGIYDSTTFTVTDWTPGQTYQLVGRLDFNAAGADEQWTVWLDPTDESDTPDIQTTKDLGYTELAAVQMWYANYNFANTDDTYIDDLRIGSSFQSVIPEPSSLALLGLGGLLIIRRRR